MIRKIKLISKFMTSQAGYKQSQYAYCPTSQEAKGTKQ